MREQSDPQRFIIQNVSQLEALFGKVRDGDPEAIHQARVATRRVRAALPVMWGVSPKLRKLFRRIGRKLGNVRELDVTRDLLASIQERLPDAAPAVAALRSDIDEARQTQTRRLVKAFDGL